jgi:hypothetical protein
MENEIRLFSQGIGASLLKLDLKDIELFKRDNYFKVNGKVLIVKISRSRKPFYGVNGTLIGLLNNLDNYYLVLLVSETEGWIYSKSEINSNIQNGVWRLREDDNNYKINYGTLRENNLFTSHAQFLEIIG